MTKIQHMVMGLQSSGKTTFAAALWHLVESREIDTVLKKGRHNGDYKYLESISTSWAAGWQVRRTASDEWEFIRINLLHPINGGQIELNFVDLSGETFEKIFVTRAVDERVAELLGGMNGLLLFVTTLRPRDDVSLVDVGMAMPEAMSEETQENAFVSNEDGSAAQSEFAPSSAPQQIQLVDLLDALSDAPISMRPDRIVVIVSAWDRALSHIEPEGWLRDRMPLLYQYLKSHEANTPYRVYGVSAQGGTLPKKDEEEQKSDRASLLKMRIAGERIKVIGHNAAAHDLTHPIRWLSGLEP